MDLRIFCEPQQGYSYDTLLGAALVAETEGFDAFFRSDHYLRMGDGDPMPGPTDAWASLAGLARDTERIRLGTLMPPVTFRLPGPLAIVVAQVDAMSGGRVELGLGAGWFDDEHRAYGIPFGGSFGERFDMLEEQLQIVPGLWATTAGETFTFAGDHYRLTDAPGLPKPVQRPRPPILVGGHGPRRTPRLAAAYADEFNVGFVPPEDVASQFERVRAACEAQGRDPTGLVYSVALPTVVGSDEAEIHHRIEAIGQSRDGLRRSGLIGTPAEVVERLEEFAAVGAQRAYVQLIDLDDHDHIRLIAREVGTSLA